MTTISGNSNNQTQPSAPSSVLPPSFQLQPVLSQPITLVAAMGTRCVANQEPRRGNANPMHNVNDFLNERLHNVIEETLLILEESNMDDLFSDSPVESQQ